MAMFVTRYPLPTGASVPTTVYARDVGHLRELIDQRGLGEGMDSDDRGFFGLRAPKMPSELLETRQLRAANHALTWVAMIAVKAGTSDAWELLNDRGLLHEMAHILHSEEEGQSSIVRDQLAFLLPKVRTFERAVPGVHPCWGGEEPERLRPSWEFDLERQVDLRPLGILRLAQTTTAAKAASRALEDLAGALSPAAAPTARPGSRKFAEAQREQGAAAKAAMVKAQLAAVSARAKKKTAGVIHAPPASTGGGILAAAMADAMADLGAEFRKSLSRMMQDYPLTGLMERRRQPYPLPPVRAINGARVQFDFEEVGEITNVSPPRIVGFDLGTFDGVELTHMRIPGSFKWFVKGVINDGL